MTKHYVGEIRRHDIQADIWQRQYRLVESLGGGLWETEQLPADEFSESLVIEHYAALEARGGQTYPIWDRTWAECGEGEAPKIVRWASYDEALDRELESLNEWAGHRSQIRFVSSAAYAAHF